MSQGNDSLQADLFGISSKGEAGLLALIEMIRAQTMTMERHNEKVDNLSSTVAKVREDIAVLKAESHRDAALSSDVAELRMEISALKLRNAQQDGGLKLATLLKDFAPWLTAILMGLIAYFKR